jgi:hypothetical protein
MARWRQISDTLLYKYESGTTMVKACLGRKSALKVLATEH